MIAELDTFCVEATDLVAVIGEELVMRCQQVAGIQRPRAVLELHNPDRTPPEQSSETRQHEMIGPFRIDLQEVDPLNSGFCAELIAGGEWQRPGLNGGCPHRPGKARHGGAVWVDEELSIAPNIGEAQCDDLRTLCESCEARLALFSTLGDGFERGHGSGGQCDQRRLRPLPNVRAHVEHHSRVERAKRRKQLPLTVRFHPPIAGVVATGGEPAGSFVELADQLAAATARDRAPDAISDTGRWALLSRHSRTVPSASPLARGSRRDRRRIGAWRTPEGQLKPVGHRLGLLRHLARSSAIDAHERASEPNDYDQSFYDSIGPGSARSAAVILPLVAEVVPFRSCVDIGCGSGEWLRAALDLGATRALGVDGNYVDHQTLKFDPDLFLGHDLESPLPDVGRFDIAMSMEVAEHLPKARAASFISELCELSDAVLFSAAAPGQGGTNHVNEQWPTYWLQHFEACNYAAFDVVRPWVWSDDRVGFWFRQNTFLAINNNCRELVSNARERLMSAPARWDTPSIEMMEQQIRRAKRATSTRQAAAELVKTATRPARRRIARWRRQRRL